MTLIRIRLLLSMNEYCEKKYFVGLDFHFFHYGCVIKIEYRVVLIFRRVVLFRYINIVLSTTTKLLHHNYKIKSIVLLASGPCAVIYDMLHVASICLCKHA